MRDNLKPDGVTTLSRRIKFAQRRRQRALETVREIDDLLPDLEQQLRDAYQQYAERKTSEIIGAA